VILSAGYTLNVTERKGIRKEYMVEEEEERELTGRSRLGRQQRDEAWMSGPVTLPAGTTGWGGGRR
jgi:hypothetical protein